MPSARRALSRALRSAPAGRSWTAVAPLAGRVLGRLLPAVPGRTVVVPPAGPGSLGDDALLTVITTELGAGADVRVAAVTRDATGSGAGTVADPGPPSLSRAFRGFPPIGWLALFRARPEAVVVVGADVMNGFYSDWRSARRWDLLSAVAGAGRDAVAAGFSWPDPDGCGPRSVAAARRAVGVRSSCRDPISARRFAAATGHEVADGADVAFLLAPDPSTAAVAEVAAWADARRAAGRHPVALNLNGLILGRIDEQPDRLVALVDGLAALAEAGIDVVLLPHDGRDGAGDRAWGAAVHATVGDRAPATLVAAPERAAEAKAMVAALDAVATGRMHLAIASLGAGTAVSLHDYQGKVEGLAALFPGADLRVALPADEWCADIAGIVGRLVAAAPERAAAIDRARPEVEAGSRRIVAHAAAHGRLG
jgi:hypothetical protein